jgi:Zn-dependent protease
MGPIGVALATGLAKLKGLWSFLYLGVKLLKFGKIALTLGSMILSIGAYTLIFGLPFAVGFVVLIFIHEMGHVYVAWKQGLPITAPVFIPFMGAIIFNKRGSDSAWSQAIMGIGGPVAGSLGACACFGIFEATGNVFYLALASVGFLLNLFNLMPIVPLDGGWIVGAVSPWLWLVGLVGLLTMTFTGHMTNPMVWVLVILSLPRVWSLFRPNGNQVPGILRPPTMPQRLTMGVCYFTLAAALMGGLSFSQVTMQNWMQQRTAPRHRFTPVASRLPERDLGVVLRRA